MAGRHARAAVFIGMAGDYAIGLVDFDTHKPGTMHRDVVAIATTTGDAGHEAVDGGRYLGIRVNLGAKGKVFAIRLDPAGPVLKARPVIVQPTARDRDVVAKITRALNGRHDVARSTGAWRIFF